MHWIDGGGSVLGVLFAVGLCAAVGAVLALPVLRLRGIYLALATLAFAVVMDDVFFTSNSVFSSSGAVQVGRPDIFGLRFVTNRSFDILIAVVLALCLIGVGALRRGPFGRRLVGMSDSPAACSHGGAEPDRDQAVGLRPVGRPGRTGRCPLRRAPDLGRGLPIPVPRQHPDLRRGHPGRDERPHRGRHHRAGFIAVLPVIAARIGCPRTSPSS